MDYRGQIACEQAFAKINLCLAVAGRRADGYHELDTLMQSVSLCDTISIVKSENTSLTIRNAPFLAKADAEKNLVIKALRALERASGRELPCGITLFKRIPAGAGLGGGSSDAAAALRGITKLYNLPYNMQKLQEIAAGIGADVPFCARGGLARAKGAGEKLLPLNTAVNAWIVLIMPKKGLKTPDVFKRFDEMPAPKTPDCAASLKLLESGGFMRLKGVCGNMLSPAAISLRPAVKAAADSAYRFGAQYAQMTGSGSAVFALFSEKRAAQSAFLALKNHFSGVFLVKPVGYLF